MRKIDNPLNQIRSLFKGAKERIIIISAFVGAQVLDSLLTAGQSSVKCEVFTRWAISDVASGASDWQAWEVAQRHKVPMFACSRLHAKLYVADDKVLLGSANATESGLRGLPSGNLELLVPEGAEMEEIQQLITEVRESSSLASPFGADILSNESSCPTDGENIALPIWIPKSDPRHFLMAMMGEAPHNRESQLDREALGVDGHALHRGDIRKALADITVFRIVRNEFARRIVPMGQTELRMLLAKQVAPDLEFLSDESVDLLVQWLGAFGENTHLNPSKDGIPAKLVPGRLLASHHA